nr:MAG TPA: hypothetical protein [Caudoviricetes sp.]
MFVLSNGVNYWSAIFCIADSILSIFDKFYFTYYTNLLTFCLSCSV